MTSDDMSRHDGADGRMTRRTALARLTHGVAAATFTPAALLASERPGSARTEAQAPDKKLGWAIVGLGSLSLNQIMPGFAECKSGKPVALVSGHPDKAQKVAEQYGVKPASIYNYENYDKIKDNSEIDIVYIVLPNGMHAEYTIRALQAGKHVLCEKPMANTVEECQAMIDAAKKANRKLMIAYRCRYEPYNRAAIETCQKGELGKLKTIVADHGFNIGDPKQWRLNKKLAGGGSLMDIGIYSLNATRYLTGEEPTRISAQVYSTPDDVRFKEVEENVNFILRFPSGVLANCTSSYGYAGANRYRVIGDKGWLDMEPATSYRGLRQKVGSWGGSQDRTFPEKSHFALEMDHMSECVINNRTPLTPGEEGLHDLQYITAIYEAARTGRTVKV
jgi:predicted dehydrogenase